MRFFNTKDRNILLKQVAAEMINITYGETYFDINGDLMEEKKPGHNNFTVDGIEYMLYPNYGYIHMDKDPNLSEFIEKNIESKFVELLQKATKKFGHMYINVGLAGTSQYMCVTHGSNNFGGYVSLPKYGVANQKIPRDSSFKWECETRPIPVSGLTASERNIYALSSIVIDQKDKIGLPNGYKSPDYPYYYDYNLYKTNNYYNDVVLFDATFGGIAQEIANMYNVAKPKTSEKNSRRYLTECVRPISFVKWEWLTPYYNNGGVLNYTECIKRGILDSNPSENVNNNCFITGMPLYDDIYVFDIIERVVIETIPKKDLHKYPNAIIVDEQSVDQPVDPLVDQPVDQPVEQLSKRGVKKQVVKRVVKPVAKKPVAKPVAKKPVLRRSKAVTEQPEEITIQYTKKYSDPKCILISPYYMHMFNLQNAVETFEQTTKTKVLVYRTKIPITHDMIIDRSDASPILKTILKALHRDANIRSSELIEASYNNQKICLLRNRRETFSSSFFSTEPTNKQTIYGFGIGRFHYS
jgi:hypothetical protein